MSVAQLDAAARSLGDLVAQVVFLGGATVGLWITDPAARPPRVTIDVDAAVEVTTLGEYERFQTELRGRGFAEDIDSEVLCRWRGPDGLVLDAVPMEAKLAGMRDRWLVDAVAAAVSHRVPSGADIRVVAPAWLLVLKLQAFADRGLGDPLASRDFEDIVVLVDGRPELVGEVLALPDGPREHVRESVQDLLGLRDFEYGVEGALAGGEGRERARAVTLPRLLGLAGR